jgi:hypothetical protein
VEEQAKEAEVVELLTVEMELLVLQTQVVAVEVQEQLELVELEVLA